MSVKSPVAGNPVSQYEVVWKTRGKDAADSMPLGNGDLGLNVWVEEEGDLLFYLGKNDAWSEVHRLLKLGRMRLHFDPPILKTADFSQTLELATGSIVIRGGSFAIRIWVDMCYPVIQLDLTAAMPVSVIVSHEPWRNREHAIVGNEAASAYGQHGNNPIVPTESADVLLPMTEGCPFLGWYHRNEHSIFCRNLERQGMGDWASTHADPLLNRTFGGLVDGERFVPTSATAITLKQPARQLTLRVAALTAQTADAATWVAQCRELLEAVRTQSDEVRFKAHGAWWKAFWERSYVRISGAGEEPGQLSQAWHLYRFLCAAQGRGEFPIKFNGGIFNVDIPGYFKDGAEANADYRLWGGPYWHQNTRQLYWPLLASGDPELIKPFFEMYRKNLPHASARTRLWYGHEGAIFPETFYLWGAHPDTNYGFDRTDKPCSFVENNYIKRHWQGSLETIAMGLDYYRYYGEVRFLRETLLPIAEAVITFYDRHYLRQAGRLRMEPAQAMESHWEVVNPAPDLAGLHCVLESLLALPPELLSPEFRGRCQQLQGELPPLPVEQVNGQTLLAVAEVVHGEAKNAESASLWAVFPYRRMSVIGGNLELARATFRQLLNPNSRPEDVGYFCWMNHNVFAAYLGLAEEARRHLAARVRYNRGNVLPSGRVANFRFAAMSGAGAAGTGDWIPDLDNLGVVQQALQAMLLQGDEKRLALLPAWPEDWDVEFKLHAPGNTVVECAFRQGRLERLQVTPDEPLKDISIRGAACTPPHGGLTPTPE